MPLTLCVLMPHFIVVVVVVCVDVLVSTLATKLGYAVGSNDFAIIIIHTETRPTRPEPNNSNSNSSTKVKLQKNPSSLTKLTRSQYKCVRACIPIQWMPCRIPYPRDMSIYDSRLQLHATETMTRLGE